LWLWFHSWLLLLYGWLLLLLLYGWLLLLLLYGWINM
jgi:hypothetical protein